MKNKGKTKKHSKKQNLINVLIVSLMNLQQQKKITTSNSLEIRNIQ